MSDLPSHSGLFKRNREKQCSRQNFEVGGCRGMEFKALVSNPAPILLEHHNCAINCCILVCV